MLTSKGAALIAGVALLLWAASRASAAEKTTSGDARFLEFTSGGIAYVYDWNTGETRRK